MSTELAKLESDKLEQMQMVLQGEQVYVDRDELPFRYTGERFKRDYPERYKAAIDLLASGQFSQREIAAFVHADHRTIHQVALTSVKDQEQRRAMLGERFFIGMMVAGERTMELMDRAQKPSEAAIPMGIYKDCYLQVAGLPTVNVEVNHHFDFTGELNRLHQELKEKVKQVQGRTLEDGSGEAAA